MLNRKTKQQALRLRKEATALAPLIITKLFETFGSDEIYGALFELYEETFGIQSDPITTEDAEWIESVIDTALNMELRY